MKRILCVILSLTLALLMLCACGKDTSEKSFTAVCSALPRTFDPQIASTEVEKIIALNCFDTLLRPDENGEYTLLSAESIDVSSDSLTYTIKIRDGLSYFLTNKAETFIKEKSGNVPGAVTAYDFAFGIIRGILPETRSSDYILLSGIKNAEKVHNGEADVSELGVKASDSRTLVITLEKPDSNFLYTLSQPICAPCNEEFFELTGGRYGLEPKYTAFCGCFYVSNTASETSVSISKNSEYKGISPAVPSSVTFYVNNDMEDIAAKLKKGTYDCAFVDSSVSEKLGNKVVKQEFVNKTYSLVFNFDDEKLNNFNLRKGLVTAVDYSFIENRAIGIVPSDFTFKGQKFSSSGISSVNTDIPAARQLLTEALKELNVQNIDINILCTSQTEALAKSIVSEWQKNVGVELNGTVSALEQNDFNSAVAKGNFQIAIYPVSSSSADAVSLLSVFTSGNSSNAFNYSSEEYDRIWAELNEFKSTDKFIYTQNFLIENTVAVPLCGGSEYFVLGDEVTGIYYFHDTSNIYFYQGRK